MGIDYRLLKKKKDQQLVTQEINVAVALWKNVRKRVLFLRCLLNLRDKPFVDYSHLMLSLMSSEANNSQ